MKKPKVIKLEPIKKPEPDTNPYGKKPKRHFLLYGVSIRSTW